MKLFLPAAAILTIASIHAGEWKQLPSLPGPVGIAAPFAGVSHGSMIVAGGANFPDKMPWEGGRKVWHDEAWILEKPDGKWRSAGKLPRPLAYGVSFLCGTGCSASVAATRSGTMGMFSA